MYLAQAKFGGLTPLGTMLDRKILRPFVLGPAKSNALRKPVLVITITDGEPQGESSDAVRSAIKDAKKTLTATQYGAGAVAFEFAQVVFLLSCILWVLDLVDQSTSAGSLPCELLTGS